MENNNREAEIHQTKKNIIESFRHLRHAPFDSITDIFRFYPIYLLRLKSNTNTAIVATDDDKLDPSVWKESRCHKIYIDNAELDENFDDQ